MEKTIQNITTFDIMNNPFRAQYMTYDDMCWRVVPGYGINLIRYAITADIAKGEEYIVL